MNFLDALDVYAFLVRDSLVLVLLGLSLFMMLNAGLFALPQVGMMAIGAYCASMLSTHADLPVPVTLLSAGVGGAVGGVLLGLALMRLDGIYLAIATLGFAEMVRVTIRNIDGLGGAVGIIGIDRSINDVEIVGIIAIAMAALVWVSRTRLGGAMRAIRQDKLMAAHQGVNVRLYRLILFIASGALAGLAGGMQVHLTGFVQPEVFDFNLLVSALVITIVGGSTFIAGPVVGATIVVGLGEVFRTLQEYQHLVNAILILVVLAFLPSGVASVFPALWRRVAPRLPVKEVATDELPSASVSMLPLHHHASPGARAVVLEVSGLSKTFGGVRAVHDVDLTLYAGEAVGIIGPNGSGKTTLLNLLSGVYRPDAGTGSVEGHPLDHRWGRPDQLARAGIARTFQTIRLIDDWTVRENVALGAYTAPACDVERLIDKAMDSVGITSLGALKSGSLPYGVRRKVEIARALVHRPHVLLLDEPTAGMSPEERHEIFELVGTIRDEGVTVVVVEHDVESIVRYSDRVVALSFGEVLAVGAPEDVIAKEAVIDAYIGHGTRS